MKNPIENVTEFILQNSTHLSTPARIRLYKDTVELLPQSDSRHRIEQIAAKLESADQACREFTFVEDQV